MSKDNKNPKKETEIAKKIKDINEQGSKIVDEKLGENKGIAVIVLIGLVIMGVSYISPFLSGIIVVVLALGFVEKQSPGEGKGIFDKLANTAKSQVGKIKEKRAENIKNKEAESSEE